MVIQKISLKNVKPGMVIDCPVGFHWEVTKGPEVYPHQNTLGGYFTESIWIRGIEIENHDGFKCDMGITGKPDMIVHIRK